MPILLYASETWTLLAEDMRKLEVFQMKCLRAILGISLRDRWRNETVRQTCFQQPTVEHKVRQARLRWFGHVCRMNNSRLPRLILTRRRPPGWKIAKNAPKKTWIKQIEVEAKHLCFQFEEFMAAAQCRQQWRGICRDTLRAYPTTGAGAFD